MAVFCYRFEHFTETDTPQYKRLPNRLKTKKFYNYLILRCLSYLIFCNLNKFMLRESKSPKMGNVNNCRTYFFTKSQGNRKTFGWEDTTIKRCVLSDKCSSCRPKPCCLLEHPCRLSRKLNKT
jgi:hypothetical protein